ncbi:FecCD family ABC transporter permease [Sinosporangium siamense]|uniref:Iron ABC transporter permease n=1 Tax=Sinosporangium siamense TaxID=1367973 RepID=A0A919RCY9_9ACTN|nr:iron ABC transporter permease [Sinosporangium siamense]GII91630.1 iron ABC transporter permease [Sinosporangium siamense]
MLVSAPTAPKGRESRWSRNSGLALLLTAVLVVAVLSLGIGSRFVPPGEVLNALFNPSSSFATTIVHDLRMPRTLGGLALGAALGMSGAVMQGLTRNPIADPGILGVHAGAAFGVVLAIHLFGILGFHGHMLFAFAGAVVVSVVVWMAGSSGRGGATPVKVALAGAAITAFVGSATTLVLYADEVAFDEFRFWTIGSLSGTKATTLVSALPFLIAGTLLALILTRGLNGLAMGEDMARSLGLRVHNVRVLSAVAVVLLSGTAVAVAGPIGFIGLTVPHLARFAAGQDYRWIVPYSALMGAVLLLGADVIGRVIASPAEVQVGAVTAAIGAPLFIWFVRRAAVRAL